MGFFLQGGDITTSFAAHFLYLVKSTMILAPGGRLPLLSYDYEYLRQLVGNGPGIASASGCAGQSDQSGYF